MAWDRRIDVRGALRHRPGLFGAPGDPCNHWALSSLTAVNTFIAVPKSAQLVGLMEIYCANQGLSMADMCFLRRLGRGENTEVRETDTPETLELQHNDTLLAVPWRMFDQWRQPLAAPNAVWCTVPPPPCPWATAATLGSGVGAASASAVRPRVEVHNVDLDKLKKEVAARGGLAGVDKHREWRQIARAMDLQPNSTAEPLRRRYVASMQDEERGQGPQEVAMQGGSHETVPPPRRTATSSASSALVLPQPTASNHRHVHLPTQPEPARVFVDGVMLRALAHCRGRPMCCSNEALTELTLVDERTDGLRAWYKMPGTIMAASFHQEKPELYLKIDNRMLVLGLETMKLWEPGLNSPEQHQLELVFAQVFAETPFPQLDGVISQDLPPHDAHETNPTQSLPKLLLALQPWGKEGQPTSIIHQCMNIKQGEMLVALREGRLGWYFGRVVHELTTSADGLFVFVRSSLSSLILSFVLYALQKSASARSCIYVLICIYAWQERKRFGRRKRATKAGFRHQFARLFHRQTTRPKSAGVSSTPSAALMTNLLTSVVRPVSLGH